MLLLIDNYDSFTYNLVQYFQYLGQTVKVFTNDSVTITDLENLSPDYLVISPGPKNPQQSGICVNAIKEFYNKIPILGICLGHQCLAYAFGAEITQASTIMHGKTSSIVHNKQRLFSNLPNNFTVTRYHSLTIEPSSLPGYFSIDAWALDTIMAISHRYYPLFGLQFHPEAILTEYGYQLLENFLQYNQLY